MCVFGLFRLQLAQADAARLSREIGTMQAAMRAGDVDPAQLVRRVASQHEARDRALLLMERLQLVEPLVNRQPGANLRNVSALRVTGFDLDRL